MGWFGMVWFCYAQNLLGGSVVWFGLVWFGMVWFHIIFFLGGDQWYGLVWTDRRRHTDRCLSV